MNVRLNTALDHLIEQHQRLLNFPLFAMFRNENSISNFISFQPITKPTLKHIASLLHPSLFTKSINNGVVRTHVGTKTFLTHHIHQLIRPFKIPRFAVPINKSRVCVCVWRQSLLLHPAQQHLGPINFPFPAIPTNHGSISKHIRLMILTSNKLEKQPKRLLSPTLLAQAINQSCMRVHIRLPTFPNHLLQHLKRLFHATPLAQPVNHTCEINQIRPQTHLTQPTKIPQRPGHKTLLTELPHYQRKRRTVNYKPSLNHGSQPPIRLQNITHSTITNNHDPVTKTIRLHPSHAHFIKHVLCILNQTHLYHNPNDQVQRFRTGNQSLVVHFDDHFHGLFDPPDFRKTLHHTLQHVMGHLKISVSDERRRARNVEAREVAELGRGNDPVEESVGHH